MIAGMTFPKRALSRASIFLAFYAGSLFVSNGAVYNFTDTTLTQGSNTYTSIDSATVTTTNYTNYSGGSPTGSATNSIILANSQSGLGNFSNTALSSGSGNFTTLYRTSDSNDADLVERGFNSSVGYDPANSSDNTTNPRYDQISGVGNPIARPYDVTVVSISGTLYFEFLMDGGESGSDRSISIDQIMIFTASANVTFPSGVETSNPSPNPVNIMSYFNNSTTANLVYSLDQFDSSGNITTNNTALVEFFDQGNGKPDFGVYVPVSSIINTVDAYNGRIYFWTEMGGFGTLGGFNFGASSTFEEWAYIKDGTPYSAIIPEPGVYVSGFLLLGLCGFTWWRRKGGKDSLLAA
jgi:hypothetical protein